MPVQLKEEVKFQSTPPRRGRLECMQAYFTEQFKFQSTPPRRGRQIKADFQYADKRVSIHAPAQGATQSAPFASCAHRCFNPRPRAGGDVRKEVE